MLSSDDSTTDDSALGRRTACLRWTLIAAWLLITFGTAFFARELKQVVIAGWPLNYWMAAQGATLSYIALIAIYAWWRNRLGDGPEGGPSDEH